MNIFDIYSRLAVTDHLVPYMQGAASGLLVALGTLTLCFAFFRAAVFGNGQEPVAWGLRFLLVLGCLAAYPQIVDSLITGSKELTATFIDKAGYEEYWAHATEQFQPMAADPAVAEVAAAGDGANRPIEPSAWDRTMGLLRGGTLTLFVSLAYGVQFFAFEWITNLAIVFVSILRLLGPLMIAAGVIGDGKTLRQWFSSMVQVLLWPVVPAVFMMITVGAGGHATQTDNVVFTICQSLMLGLFALVTPLVVMFVLGRGGVATAAAAVTGLLGAATLAGARALSPPLARFVRSLGGAGSAAPKDDPDGPAAESGGTRRPADAAGAAVVDADPPVRHRRSNDTQGAHRQHGAGAPDQRYGSGPPRPSGGNAASGTPRAPASGHADRPAAGSFGSSGEHQSGHAAPLRRELIGPAAGQHPGAPRVSAAQRGVSSPGGRNTPAHAAGQSRLAGSRPIAQRPGGHRADSARPLGANDSWRRD